MTNTRVGSDTRERLLEAGMELLREEPVGNVLSQVKAARVARRAGLTQGAFFHHWPTQADFVCDLLDHALGDHRFAAAERLLAEGSALLEAGRPLEEVIGAVCRSQVERLAADPTFQVQTSIWGRHSIDPAVTERLRELYRSSDSRFAAAYQAVLEAEGLRPRPGYTYEMMATITGALLEGLVMRRQVDPDAVPVELFGQLVLELLPQVTEPAGP